MSEPRRRVKNPPAEGIKDQGLERFLQDVADALNEPDVEVREFIQLSTATTLRPQATTVYLFEPTEAITVTLPLAKNVRTFHFYVKNLSSVNTVTLDAQGNETIDLAGTFPLLQNDSVRLTSDNTNYWIL